MLDMMLQFETSQTSSWTTRRRRSNDISSMSTQQYSEDEAYYSALSYDDGHSARQQQWSPSYPDGAPSDQNYANPPPRGQGDSLQQGIPVSTAFISIFWGANSPAYHQEAVATVSRTTTKADLHLHYLQIIIITIMILVTDSLLSLPTRRTTTPVASTLTAFE